MSIRTCLALLFCAVGLEAQVAIVNGASFRPEQPVAPGSWVAAFGTFSGITATAASGLPLPKSLAGVKVTVGGVDAAVLDVRNTQITFLMPYASTPGLRPVVITTPSGNINGSVRVMASAPGIFKKDDSTPPRGAVQNQDGVTENSSTSPAKRGEVISIYATGPGPLNRAVEDGAAPGAPPATTVSTPQVFIGGVEATVQFSGLNQDAPGLWQINAVVPDLPFVKGRVAVQVFLDGVDSNEVAVFVQ